jgi:hypothetical protein
MSACEGEVNDSGLFLAPPLMGKVVSFRFEGI